MVKVQDKLSKIGERIGLRAPSADIALQVPEQRSPGAGSFPIDPALVADYLEQLKSVSSESSTAELIRALQHSNRLATTPSDRLQIARLFESAVAIELTDLNAGFTGVDLPYPAHSATDFDHATTLLQELAASYKVILLDVLRRRGNLHRKHRLPVIFQAIKHLSECGLRFSQSYQPWPEKMWRDLNTLYLCAEREQGVDSILRKGDCPQSIKQLYSQCCLFAACSGPHLSPHDMSRLYRLLGKYSLTVDLTDKKQSINSNTQYCVALDSAHPPCVARFSRLQPGQQVRFLDLEPVLAMLPGDEVTCDEDSLTQSTGHFISAETSTSQLRNVVGGMGERQHGRSVRQTLLHAESGMKEIHASLLPTGSNRLKPANGSKNDYGTQWIIENRSKGGLGLKWTGKGNCRVNVGELIAHYEHASQDSGFNLNWHIGIVRWIHSDGQDKLRCGVESLANYAAAVTANHTNGSRSSTSAEALLLNEHPAASRPSMLLVPRRHYKIGEKINIHNADHTRPVKLIENYPVGGNYNCFGYQAIN